ncbi:hypothetical protein [Pseudomonas sp.]|uniref:hypothetical protein n=1 Tax=Pseudomonas sp. TaxID=306 RepID=UPI0025871112|nr:hypothetical protein [Pseudomonas sp.]
MSSNLSFSKMIGDWASATEERLSAAHRRSVVLLGEEMITTKPQGGRLPFDTGNLARSLLASTQAMPKTATGQFPGSNVGVVAATLRPEQPVWLGYQAVYARRMNYGFVGADSLGRVYNQSGNHFVEGAIAKWPQIVAQAVRETQANAKR